MILMLTIPLNGCAASKTEYDIPDDNYRNFYEIFVASFQDSDGDRVGDINGVTSKLDYLKEMGYTGIWLMPISPSPSYHKYDVVNYYDVDRSYGTLDDFVRLCQEAHKRDIKVITDMVINHSSSSNPWFLEAADAYVNGKKSPYLVYYNFSDYPQYGYSQYGNTGKYYESRFVDTMPDLNLDSLSVRNEIVSIMKFWIDKGADGFRLDACTSYYTGKEDKNVEFLSWLNEEARKLKEDIYIVGEAWTGDNVIKQYYTSGIDSFFQFSLSNAEGTIASVLKNSNPQLLYRNALKNSVSLAQGHIPAVFLDNHDMTRITTAIGRSKLERIKFAYGLLGMMNGAVFTYYGTEIGMIGSRKDENYRIAMLWDSNKTDALCKNPPGVSQTEYAYEGVAQQQKDSGSILNYHKAINLLRNRYPEIGRGEIDFINELCNKTVMVVTKSCNDSTIAIAINFSETESAQLDFSETGYKYSTAVSAYGQKAESKGDVLTLPPYTIAILERGK